MPITITVPELETFNEATSMFVTEEAITLELEHSLVSLSKWEAITGKPFLGPAEKTNEDIYLYIQAMCITPGVSLEVIKRIDQETFTKINEHIDSKMTATWFSDRPGKKVSREIVTAELLYHWMFALNVPMELENWHLSRLFTQLRVIDEKSKKPEKLSRADAAARHREINARNKAAMGTTG